MTASTGCTLGPLWSPPPGPSTGFDFTYDAGPDPYGYYGADDASGYPSPDVDFDDVDQAAQFLAGKPALALPLTSATPTSGLAPLSGGTLAYDANSDYAVAADSERDVVHIVHFLGATLNAKNVVTVVALKSGDEPGRVAFGPPGQVFVALRRGGAVVTIDLGSASLVERRNVCPDPRGLAFDAVKNVLWIACSSGDLVQLPAAGLPELSRQFVASDLRDVVLNAGKLWLSEFRSANVWSLDDSGKPQLAAAMSKRTLQDTVVSRAMSPAVAWRMIAAPEAGVLIAHQRGQDSPIAGVQAPTQAYYGQQFQPTFAIVQGVVSRVTETEVTDGPLPLDQLNMPVDITMTANHNVFAVADPSAGRVELYGLAYYLKLAGLYPTVTYLHDAVAVAFRSNEQLLVLTREPAIHRFRLANSWFSLTNDDTIVLNGAPIDDFGHRLFHTATSVGIACASCHPEGRDDGRVWHFAGKGARRTQAIWGGLMATAPFHWTGDLTQLGDLMDSIFSLRMGGDRVTGEQAAHLGNWLDQLPVPAATPNVDPVDAAAGKKLFESTEVGCSSCHEGPHFTNNKTVDVGTGGEFQVPTLLGVSAHLPIMHDGCGVTLAERFNPACGGSAHGKIDGLIPDQIATLVAYLQTL